MFYFPSTAWCWRRCLADNSVPWPRALSKAESEGCSVFLCSDNGSVLKEEKSVLDDTQQVTGLQALVWEIIETGSLERLPSNQAITLSLRLGFLHDVVNSLANNSILFGLLVNYFYFCTEVVTWNWYSKSLSCRWTHFCAGIETLSFAVNLRTDTRWKQISEMYIHSCSFLPLRLEKMTAWQVSRIPIFRRLLPGSE